MTSTRKPITTVARIANTGSQLNPILFPGFSIRATFIGLPMTSTEKLFTTVARIVNTGSQLKLLDCP